MPILVTCACGTSINAPDSYAGKLAKCPGCGQGIRVPAQQASLAGAVAPPLGYVTPGPGRGPIAPPPDDHIQLPTFLAEKFRQPGCPPLYLVFSVEGADIQADFDASPVLQKLAEVLAGKLKKRFDVQLEPPPQEGTALAFVRVLRMYQGNRTLRYLLGPLGMLFSAGTTLEVDGNVRGPSGASIPFEFKHRCHLGLFGGVSLNLLKVNATVIAKKIAARVKSVQ